MKNDETVIQSHGFGGACIRFYVICVSEDPAIFGNLLRRVWGGQNLSRTWRRRHATSSGLAASYDDDMSTEFSNSLCSCAEGDSGEGQISDEEVLSAPRKDPKVSEGRDEKEENHMDSTRDDDFAPASKAKVPAQSRHSGDLTARGRIPPGRQPPERRRRSSLGTSSGVSSDTAVCSYACAR
jgi:hypothetical protein